MTKHRIKNSCANFIAQKLITDCLSEDNILRDAVSAIGGGGGGGGGGGVGMCRPIG